MASRAKSRQKAAAVKRSATGAAALGREPAIDLATTRDVLEQLAMAHRLAGSAPLGPPIQARISAAIARLADRLPAGEGSLRASLPMSAAGERELSGPEWVARFPGSDQPSDCVEPFRSHLQGFLAALARAGASVRISATFRPPERAYLMHWSWRIATNAVLPQDVPSMTGVEIEWMHSDPAGGPDIPKSRSAAKSIFSTHIMTAYRALGR